MIPKIRWQTDDEQGAIALRGDTVHLVWTGNALERVSRALAEADDGLLVELLPEQKIRLQCSGGFSLEAQGKNLRKVILRSDLTLQFSADEIQGQLSLEGMSQGNDPLLGQELGGFQVLALLGVGAMGRVYQAKQIALDRLVALKVLHPQTAQDPIAVASFAREARAAGALAHPNLVAVFDVGKAKGLHFFAMEMVSGGSLEDRLQEDGPFAWKDAVDSIRECAEALSFAEEHDLVHRDIKPENLMIADSGHLKLADLGLAVTRGMVDLKSAGGTPHFMSPEAAQNQEVDHRADLYSLGCTLFRLLTGDTLFTGENVQEILRAQVEDEPPTLRQSGVSVPGDLERLLADLLSKDPDERPESAAEVVDRCEGLLKASLWHRRLVLGLVLVGAALGGWRLLNPPELQNPLQPKVVEVVRDNPEAAAKLKATQIRLAFAEAMAQSSLVARRASLLVFLEAHPNSEQAKEAKIALEDLALAENEQQSAPEANPVLVQLETDVAKFVQNGRPGKAWDSVLVVADLGVTERGLFLNSVRDAAKQLLLETESQHRSLSEQRNHEAAESLRLETSQALQCQGFETEGWAGQIEQWRQADLQLQEDDKRKRFADARSALTEALSGPIAEALARGEFSVARAVYQEAVYSAASHLEFSSEATRIGQIVTEAHSAWTEITNHLSSGPPSSFLFKGQKMTWHAFEEGRLQVEVQENGKRVSRELVWNDLIRPSILPKILASAWQGPLGDSSFQSLLLLLAAERTGAQLARLDLKPTPSSLLQSARETEDWVVLLMKQNPSAIQLEEIQALQTAAGFLRAMAEDQPYEAVLHLEHLLARMSLTALRGSDGTAPWGMKP